MATASLFRRPVWVLWILLLAFSISCSIVCSGELSLVVGETSKLQLSPSLEVANSPGAKPGSVVLCERVHIHGLSRLHNLKKYSNSLKLNLSRSSSFLRRPAVEVCFHMNKSLGIGMCPQAMWEKVGKGGSWVRAMSPFGHKLLDIRIGGLSPETLELQTEEEFFLYRVVFLIFGVILLCVASSLSKSLVFYYSSAMAIGIILVILVILFQVGLGTFILGYLPGLVRSVLVEMGVSEDLYYPLGVFILAFVVLAGAWMGFWAVRKLVLAEDGSVDTSTSNFVAWSIRILAVAMILQSSLDPLLLLAAVVSGVMFEEIFRSGFLCVLYKKSLELVQNINGESIVPDLSPFRGSYDRRTKDSRFVSPQPRRSTMTYFDSVQGLRSTPPRLSESDVYPSTFHSTPERRQFSRDEWEEYTKETTRKAIRELVSSPDFGRWAADNAERISVTPRSSRHSRHTRHKWFLWF
ncbi:hypothetical protein Tsubulata_000845 [Turnera subulata]|uniref:Uncharacterized protein n=1 Tax=Turnera subulata TaxID=218843 RepID=A0A9Q0JJM1_9ROSI|nr:hypothetical protein Tsubulata_000845 [Turnera subulata]